MNYRFKLFILNVRKISFQTLNAAKPPFNEDFAFKAAAGLQFCKS